uniref:Capsid protein n=1 Tax=Porcine serum-associated circular virus TaxID=1891204 RepID=A0A170RBT9_9VIRU|nr:capsid protein [Porcine serum-associated circular virus]
MARYVRYKRYYKKVYPKKRWASNLLSKALAVTLPNGVASNASTSTICENAVQSSKPTPTILKFGRVKIKGDVRTNANNAANFTSANVFVVFVPEGVTLTPQVLNSHPEYIMGWTTLSMDSGNSFSLTTALKRNLNSGDSIQLLFAVDTISAPQIDIVYNFYYTAQFWTTTA